MRAFLRMKEIKIEDEIEECRETRNLIEKKRWNPFHSSLSKLRIVLRKERYVESCTVNSFERTRRETFRP